MNTPVYSKIRETEGIVALMRLLRQVDPAFEDGEYIAFGLDIPRKMVKAAIDDGPDGPLPTNWTATEEWMRGLVDELRVAIQPVMEARLAALEARLRETIFDAVMANGPEGGADAA